MGPFFSDVAEWLESLGRNAVNVVFNGGDRFYCRHRQYLAYYQTPKEFPGWLRDLHRQYDFDTILCFGDCRPLHKEAKRWAKSKGSASRHLKKDIYARNLLPLKKAE